MTERSWEGALNRSVRIRPDIEWTQFYKGNLGSWVARDPISMEYFHFRQSEYQIARQLDGHRTLQEVLTQLPLGRATAEGLVRLVVKLDNACLTVPQVAGEVGKRLWLSHERLQRRGVLQRLLSPLAIRIKLLDPTPLLSILAPVAQLLFSKFFIVLWFIFGILVGSAVCMQLLDHPSSLTSSFENVTTLRALGLVAMYVLVKSIHELGHALACKKWRAECHEIGVFLLVFTPCLYCNTSDSWKLSSRWRRACIAAAGIYVELILASIAGLVWLATASESVFHLLAANVMLICSLSTVLVNGNPLLRYDGYYVLADLWAVPNLAEQAREALRASCVAWLTGMRLPEGRWDGHPRWLALYGLAAGLYRHFVALMIVWVIWRLMDNLGLNLVGVFFAAITVVNLLLAGTMGLYQLIRETVMAGGMRFLRFALVMACGIVGLGVCFYQTWPTTVSSRAVTSLVQLTPVYAEHAGTLAEFATIGQVIEKGKPIARIESPPLQLKLIDTRGKVAFLEQRTTQLKARLVDDKSSATELAKVIEELAKEREQLRILDKEAAALVNVSPHAGVLMAGQWSSVQSLTELHDAQSLKPVLSATHRGSSVERGTLLGWISPTATYELTAYVAERDAELLSPGMPVRVRWDCESNQRFDGVVSRIAPEPITEIPDALRGDESIPMRMGEDGKLQPAKPHYETKIEMQAAPDTLGHHAMATVHFVTAPRTVAQTLQRLFDTHARPSL